MEVCLSLTWNFQLNIIKWVILKLFLFSALKVFGIFFIIDFSTEQTCDPTSLRSPRNGVKRPYYGLQPFGFGLQLKFSCNSGYSFPDGTKDKVVKCSKNLATSKPEWDSKYIPDCTCKIVNKNFYLSNLNFLYPWLLKVSISLHFRT